MSDKPRDYIGEMMAQNPGKLRRVTQADIEATCQAISQYVLKNQPHSSWVKALSDGYTIWDIGQLPKGVKALFRRMAKRGEIFEGRDYWAGLGRQRFYWHTL